MMPDYDPLDDMDISAVTLRFFRLRAALTFAMRNTMPLAKVFEFYELDHSELDWLLEIASPVGSH